MWMSHFSWPFITRHPPFMLICLPACPLLAPTVAHTGRSTCPCTCWRWPHPSCWRTSHGTACKVGWVRATPPQYTSQYQEHGFLGPPHSFVLEFVCCGRSLGGLQKWQAFYCCYQHLQICTIYGAGGIRFGVSGLLLLYGVEVGRRTGR